MKTVLVAVLGLISGFVSGEPLAAIAGTISFAAFSSIPSGPVLWFFRSLPVLSALVCAAAAVALYLRRRPG